MAEVKETTELNETQINLTAKAFRGFADPTRLKILHYLMEKERSVSELVDLLGISQGRVSNHLACLRWCNFVNTNRRGKFVYYELADERVKEIIELAKDFMTDNAEYIYSCTRM